MTMAEALLKEGEEKGREAGRAESLQNVARAMLRKGLPTELIVETTGLTADEIQALGTEEAPGKELQQED